MYLHKYKDYEEYKNIQVIGNKQKLSYSWVNLNNLYKIVEFILDINPKVSFGLCHGTRRGFEQKQIKEEFSKRGKDVNVIGTEISDTANQFESTIEWDFHIAKEEWINNTDIIYTNSFDHSPKPKECLDIWMSCLKENGVCIIEYSDVCDSKSGRIDCFGATLDEYKEFITEKYDIVDILTNEGIPDVGFSHKGDRWYIVIKNRK